MLFLGGGALLVGMAASLVVPFVPFAFALTLAIVLGAGWAGFHGASSGQVIVSALALLLVTQVAYGFGLIGMAAAQSARQSLRRPSAAKSIAAPLSDLHIGEKH